MDCTKKITENEIYRMFAPAVASIEKNILVFGGGCSSYSEGLSTEYYSYHVIHMYNLDSEKWFRHVIPDTQTVPPPTLWACATAVGDEIFQFGGRLGVNSEGKRESDDTNALWKLTRGKRSFEWLEIQFDNKHTTPSPRSKACAWECDGKFWAFGGVGPKPDGYLSVHGEWYTDAYYTHKYYCNQLLSYDPVVGAWSDVQSLGAIPSPRDEYAMTKAADTVFLYGARPAIDELYKLEMHTLTWTHVQPVGPNVPLGRRRHTITALTPNLLILHGGLYDMNGTCADTWLFDVQSLTWTKNEENRDRFDHIAFEGNNNIIILGGLTCFPEWEMADILYMSIFYEPTGLVEVALRNVHKNLKLLEPKEYDMPEEIFLRLENM